MTIDGPYAEDLRLALRIADAVDKITMAGFRQEGLMVDHKDDRSPVTEIDRRAELAIRDVLEEARPRDGIHGEEFGTKGGGARKWVIDPVDGTKNYIRGIPIWGTLIALLDDSKPVMGVVSAPAMAARWYAAQGQGAWKGTKERGARRLQVSTIDTLKQSTLSYSSLEGWEERGMLDQFIAFHRKLWRTRAFGDFWSYMLVAEGVVEIATEPELALWDMAALVPIVEEAGGRFTSISGAPGPWGGDALVTNGLVHDAALESLKGAG